jgi:hypothetical protein
VTPRFSLPRVAGFATDASGRRRAMLAAVAVAAAGLAGVALARRDADRYALRPLVSDIGLAARPHDAQLVNAWGLAASPTGPWWTANEARGSSSLYSGDGDKQALTVRVDGGRVTISGEASAFKELARLCLLLGGASGGGDSFELQPSVHVGSDSPGLKLELT